MVAWGGEDWIAIVDVDVGYGTRKVIGVVHGAPLNVALGAASTLATRNIRLKETNKQKIDYKKTNHHL